MGWRGLSKRVMSPSSATRVAASTGAMPRDACNARTTGASSQSASAASICASKRSRRAVVALAAAMQPSNTMQ